MVENTKVRNNKAKGTRQNGSVTSGEGVPWKRWNKNGDGDCLLKTQDSAKS